MHTDDRSRRADEAALARLLDAQIAAWAAGDVRHSPRPSHPERVMELRL
ncbi:hypothetical protein AB4305_13405 [Nocardia sp. 2YAB30]